MRTLDADNSHDDDSFYFPPSGRGCRRKSAYSIDLKVPFAEASAASFGRWHTSH